MARSTAFPPAPAPAMAARLAGAAAAAAIALHLAAAGPAPDADGADAPPAPACVGCHHGGDDDEPAPGEPQDGGVGALTGRERAALVAFGAAREVTR